MQSVIRNVSDIGGTDRQTLEGMLGGPLATDQEVFILAYTPGVLPNEQTRREAKMRLERTLANNQAFAEEQGVTSSEADEAVVDAMRHVRRRE